MAEESDSTVLKLQLFRCKKCRRSFFSSERRNSHFKTKHVKKYKLASQTTLYKNKNDFIKIPKKKSSMGRTEALFSTLLSNWPPENAHAKLQSRHRLSEKRVNGLFKRWLNENYSPMIHGSQDAKKVLTQEYSKDSMLTQERLTDLSFLTGLSPKFIRLWFHWKKMRGHLSSGDQVLYKEFLNHPYVDDSTLQTLMNETGLLLSQIRLWFRLSRAKYRVMEFKEVEEKVLWAWFLKSADSKLEDKEIDEVSKLVGMKNEDVKTIFKYWNDAWFVADVASKEKLVTNSQEICDLLGIDITKHENVLSALEKARNNQKMFGIPICCKVLKSGKTTQFPANFPFLKTFFESYMSKDVELSYDESAAEEAECDDRLGSGEVDDLITDEIETIRPSSDLLDDNLLLKVQCDVLKPIQSQSPGVGTENEEQNLYSLFNTTPSTVPCGSTGHIAYSSEDDPDYISSSPETSHPIISEIAEIISDSGGESESSFEIDEESTSAVEFVAEEFNHTPYAFIDLTLDSDHSISDQEILTEDSSIASPSDMILESTANSSVNEIGCTSILSESDDVDDSCSSPSTLVICESDEEASPNRNRVITNETSSSTNTTSHDNTCESQIPSSNHQISDDIAQSDNSTQSNLDCVTANVEEAAYPVTQPDHIIIHPTSLQEARKKHAIPSRNDTLSRRKAIFIEPITISQLQKNHKVHRRKNCAGRKHLKISKTLFSKSLAECRMSSYQELKRNLHKKKATKHSDSNPKSSSNLTN